MTLLAEAYADAHLNLDPLDADLVEAAQRLTRTFERIEESARINVTVDTTQASAQLAALERSVGNQVVDITFNVDEASLAGVIAEVEAAFRDVTIDANVRVDSAAAVAELAALEALGDDLDLSVDIQPGRIVGDTFADVRRTADAALDGIRDQIDEVFGDTGDVDGFGAAVGRVMDGAADDVRHLADEVTDFQSNLGVPDVNILGDIPRHATFTVSTEGVAAAVGDADSLRAAFEQTRRAAAAAADVDWVPDSRDLDAAAGAVRVLSRDLSGWAINTETGANLTDRFNDALRRLGTEADTNRAKIRLTRGELTDYLADLARIPDFELPDLTPQQVALGEVFSDILAGLDDSEIEAEVDLSTVAARLKAVGLAEEIQTLVGRRIEVDVDFDRTAADRFASSINPLLRRALDARNNGGIFSNTIKSVFQAGIQGVVQSALGGLQSFLNSSTQAATETATEFASLGIEQGVEGITKAGETAERTLDELSQKMEDLANNIGEAASSFGASLLEGGPRVAIMAVQFGAMAAVLYSIVNLVGVLVSLLAAAVAYVIPLAAGLAGAAVGLLALGAAATVAVGAVGALTFGLTDTADAFGDLFAGLRQMIETIRPALEPIRDFLFNTVGTGFNLLIGAAERLAPVFITAFEPLVDVLLPIIEILGEIAGPIAVAVGAGLARITGTISALFEAVDPDRVIRGIDALFVTLDRFISLIGEAGLAFPLEEFITSLGGIAEDALLPFLEIIATFAPIMGTLGDSISAFLEPLKSLAVTFGQGVAAMAPFIDEMIRLFQAIFPGFDFAVVEAMFSRLTPLFADFLDRIGPLLDRISEAWIRLAESLFSDQIISLWLILFEQVLIITEAWANAMGGAEGSAGTLAFAMEGVLTTILAVNGAIAVGIFAWAGFWEAVLWGVDQAITGLAKIVRGIAAVVDAASSVPVLNWAVDEGTADRLRDQAAGLETLLDGARQTTSEIRKSAGAIITMDYSTRTATRTLDSFANTMDRADRSARILTEGQKALGRITAGIAQAYAPATKALEAARSGFTEHSISGFLDDEADAIDRAGRNTRGLLADYFRVEGEEAEKAQRTARSILEFGSIADYMNRENLDIDRAIQSLVVKLEKQAENLRRLNFLAALGFDPLVAQLGQLRSNPEMLSKAIDDLTAGGVGALRAANDKIGGAQIELAAVVSSLDADLADAIGLGDNGDAEQAIEDKRVSLEEAIGNATTGIAQRAQNVAGLQSLYNRGFTTLATEFASLAGNPEELASVLAEAEASGVGALQRYEAALSGQYNALESRLRSLPTPLAEALGQPVEEATAALGESTEKAVKSNDQFFTEYFTSIEDQLNKANALRFLVDEGFFGVADALAPLAAGDEFEGQFNQLLAGGLEALQNREAQINDYKVRFEESQQAFRESMSVEALENNAALAEYLGGLTDVDIDDVTADLAAVGAAVAERTRRSINEGWIAGWRGEVAPPEPGEEGYGVLDPDKMSTAGTEAGVAGGTAWYEGLTTGMIPSDADLESSVDGLLGPVINSGAEAGTSFATEFSTALADNVEAIVTNFGAQLSYDAALAEFEAAGQLAGFRYAGSIVAGVTDSGEALALAVAGAVAGAGLGSIALAYQGGTVIGQGLMVGAVVGVAANAQQVAVATIQVVAGVGGILSSASLRIGSDVGGSLIASMAIGIAANTSGLVVAFLSLFGGLADVSEAAATELGELATDTLAEAIEDGADDVAEAITAVFELAPRAVEPVARITGRAVGNYFVDGTIAGLEAGGNQIGFAMAAAFARATDALDVVVHGYGRLLGLLFGAGITEGLGVASNGVRLAATRLALELVEVVQDLLDINSPSRVAANMGEFFGLGLADGITRTRNQVAAAADTLAGTVTDAVSSSLDDVPELTPTITPEVVLDGALGSLRGAVDDFTAASTAATPISVAATDLSAVVSGSATPTQQAADPQVIAVLAAILAAIEANPTVIEALFENYNVYGVEEPQSPQQFAEDADFVAALVR